MNKLARALIALMLLITPISALGETRLINFSDSCYFIGEDGTAAAPFLRAYALTDGGGETAFYACRGLSGLYALADADGQLLTDFLYDSIEYSVNVCVCSRGGKVYYIRGDGSARETEYCALELTSDETALALSGNLYDESADMLKVVYRDGFVFDSSVRTSYGLGNFSDGLMAVMDYSSGLFGYVDANGMWAVPPQFRYAGDFSGGCAIVSDDAGYRLIDKTGSALTRGTYSFMERGEDAVWCVSDDIVSAYAFDGAFLFSTYLLRGGVRVLGRYAVLYDENVGYVCLPTGEQLFELAPGASVCAYSDRFIIREDGLCRLLGESGETLAGPYPKMEFVSDCCAVWDGSGFCALISPDGEELSAFVFDEITSDGEIYAGRTGETITVIPFSR